MNTIKHLELIWAQCIMRIFIFFMNKRFFSLHPVSFGVPLFHAYSDRM